MTPEELAAIEARIDGANPWSGDGVRQVLEHDAPALVAEVRRLQAKLKTTEEDEAEMEAQLARYRSHLIAIRKIAEGDV